MPDDGHETKCEGYEKAGDYLFTVYVDARCMWS